MGSGGAIGLNFLAVERIALLAGIREDEILHFFITVDSLAKQVIDYKLAEMEAQRETERKRNK